MDLPLPRLRGVHQLANAATAIAALRFAGLDLPDSAFETGIESVRWPGRMERLKPGPLQARAPENCELWIDGGHNPAAGEVIASELANLEERAPMPVFIIAGMLTTRIRGDFFAPSSGWPSAFSRCPSTTARGFGERELARDCRRMRTETLIPACR